MSVANFSGSPVLFRRRNGTNRVLCLVWLTNLTEWSRASPLSMGVTLDLSPPSIAPPLSVSSKRTRPLALRRCVMRMSAVDAMWAWPVGVAATEEEEEDGEGEGEGREEGVVLWWCCCKSLLQLS